MSGPHILAASGLPAMKKACQKRSCTQAAIAHAQNRGAALDRQRHLHGGVLARELDRVREQVPHHLLQARAVGVDRRRDRVEDGPQPDVLGVRRRLGRVERRLDDAEQRDLMQVEPDLARHDPLPKSVDRNGYHGYFAAPHEMIGYRLDDADSSQARRIVANGVQVGYVRRRHDVKAGANLFLDSEFRNPVLG